MGRTHRHFSGRIPPAARLLAGTVWLMAACAGGSGDDVLPPEALRAAMAVDADSVLTLPTGDSVRVSAATLEFYEGRQYQPAWTDGRALTAAGRGVHDAIGQADTDGLSPERYGHDTAARLLAALEPESRRDRLPDSASVQHRVALELLLTEGMARYSADLVTGTLDPEEAGVDWRIERESARQGVVLENLAAGRDAAEVVDRLRPAIPYYDRMRTALAAFREAADRGGWPEVPAGETLREGERNAGVAALRERLVRGTDGQEAELARAGSADPTLFDAALKEAVERFQRRHSIDPDGAVGPETLKELNHTVDERIAEMKLNLDRWRWLPNELGERFVMVNIAGFELEVVESGRAIESMSVVVGRLERQTPVFADSIQFVVVNPYWNIPDGIYSRDVRPKMEQDPTYLVRNNMEFVNGRVRQKPGPNNALGRYKFLFPNEFDVYLHDSPEGHLFSRTRRDFSSGCIRLERPEDFARLLLQLQTDNGSSQLDAHLTHWNERWIKLDRTLPVYLLYFTAWVDEDGTVRFHHDVYGRDDKFAPQMEERLDTRVAMAQ